MGAVFRGSSRKMPGSRETITKAHALLLTACSNAVSSSPFLPALQKGTRTTSSRRSKKSSMNYCRPRTVPKNESSARRNREATDTADQTTSLVDWRASFRLNHHQLYRPAVLKCPGAYPEDRARMDQHRLCHDPHRLSNFLHDHAERGRAADRPAGHAKGTLDNSVFLFRYRGNDLPGPGLGQLQFFSILVGRRRSSQLAGSDESRFRMVPG